MPRCPTHDELEAYFAHACEGSSAASIRTHLGECDRCRDWLDSAQADEALLVDVRRVVDGASSAAGPLLLPGAVQRTPQVAEPAIPGYRILRCIGQGGMGVVYEAEQLRPRRAVAIKVVRAGLAGEQYHVRLLQREAQALARLKHPGIAAIHEAGYTDDGRPFFVMELVSGVDLKAFVAAHHPALSVRLRLFCDICDAINYAHQRGVIHRDLKPGNILVSEGLQIADCRLQIDGKSPKTHKSAICNLQSAIPKVLDFGLARITDADATVATPVTEVGKIQGTLPYMSPEQVRGDPDAIDLRSDVYALGVILYELLTGALPYDVTQKPLPEVARIIAEASPHKPSQLNKRLRGDLDTIVLKALEKSPPQRYQSAAALADDIDRYLTHQPILARPPSALYQLRKLAARHKLPFALALALLILVIGSAVVAAVQANRIADERNLAIAAQQSEVEARGQAEREAERAAAEARKAERINQFLRDMLAAVDPKKTRHSDITVRSVLDQAAQRIGDELADQPEVEAAVRDTIGMTYRDLGVYASAAPHLERALEIRQSLHPGPHADVATSLNNLAILRAAAGDLQGAEPLVQQALAMWRALRGADDIEVAASANNLCSLLSELGRLDEAEPLAEEVLRIRRLKLPDPHADLGAALNNLGDLYLSRGRWDEAEAFLRAGLEMRQHVLDPDHPDVAESQSNLGRVLEERGQLAAAEPLLRESLESAQRRLGEHPSVARALNNLGVLVLKKSDYDQAEPLLRDALDMRKRTLPADHADIGESLNNLGMLAQMRGAYDDAEVLLRDALTVRQKTLPPDHPEVTKAMSNLAMPLHSKRDFAGAAELLGAVLEVRRAQLPAGHPDLIQTVYNMAVLRRDQGDLDAAEPLFREALAGARDQLGPAHPTLAHYLTGLGSLLQRRDDLSAADVLFREALTIRRAALPPDHPDTTAVMIALADVLVRREAFAEAENLLREARQSQQNHLPAGNVSSARLDSLLGACLSGLIRYDEAEPLLVESYAVLQDKLGPQHSNTLDALNRIIHLYETWGRPEQAETYRQLR